MLLPHAPAPCSCPMLLLPTSKMKQHPMLADVKYQRLKEGSPTRQRLQRAAELFAEVRKGVCV